MTMRKSSFTELLLQGAREAAAHASGDPTVRSRSRITRRPLSARTLRLERPSAPSPAQIRELRGRLRLSQTLFSDLLNVSASTVRAWEQGQRVPDGASVRLLEVAREAPDALLRLGLPRGDVAGDAAEGDE